MNSNSKPELKFIRLKRFDKRYQGLDLQVQEKVDRTLLKYAEDQTSPGLRVEKIEGTNDVWGMRVNPRYRISFQKSQDVVILRTVDVHNRVYRAP